MPTQNPVPDRYERRRMRNRAALLEAATLLFQHRGVAATKIEDICERAGVSPRTFFNHFETRGHLFQAIAEQRAEQLAALLEADAHGRPLGERLTLLFEGIAAYVGARPAYRELVGEMLGLRLKGGNRAARVLGEAVLRFVGSGTADGRAPMRHSPEVLADLLLGAVTTALTHWCADEHYDLERSLRQSAVALAELSS